MLGGGGWFITLESVKESDEINYRGEDTHRNTRPEGLVRSLKWFLQLFHLKLMNNVRRKRTDAILCHGKPTQVWDMIIPRKRAAQRKRVMSRKWLQYHRTLMYPYVPLEEFLLCSSSMKAYRSLFLFLNDTVCILLNKDVNCSCLVGKSHKTRLRNTLLWIRNFW